MSDDTGLYEPTCLVLLAHGSRDPEWRVPFEELRDGLAVELGPERVRLAYMEMTAPTLRETVLEAATEGWDRLVVLPLFLATGRHMNVDVPRLVAEARTAAPGLEIVLRPAVGEHPGIFGVLHRLALEAVAITGDGRGSPGFRGSPAGPPDT